MRSTLQGSQTSQEYVSTCLPNFQCRYHELRPLKVRSCNCYEIIRFSNFFIKHNTRHTDSMCIVLKRSDHLWTRYLGLFFFILMIHLVRLIFEASFSRKRKNEIIEFRIFQSSGQWMKPCPSGGAYEIYFKGQSNVLRVCFHLFAKFPVSLS